FGDEAKTEPTAPTVDVKTLHAKIGEHDHSQSACQGHNCAGHRHPFPAASTG
ncbi:hypothetical protein GOL97_32165, partial [Sinorhizobium medicae]|nr:hypothetical protein [Sinorhizobium medicae]MDX0692385.1 hypothetical protein [Sinorhizobium medicae]MDX0919773.1 hypothetical protein [Sinorhizobium medicae]MDX0974308.1 hypothetical protein [Sinorhizobium medicae]MDX1207826.1 hypothetical protein [Sinorhizobium medicae]